MLKLTCESKKELISLSNRLIRENSEVVLFCRLRRPYIMIIQPGSLTRCITNTKELDEYCWYINNEWYRGKYDTTAKHCIIVKKRNR